MKHARQLLLLTAALAVVNLGTSCIHKTGGAQVSPYERAVTYSTMLAQVNNSVAQGVIQANQTGLISANNAREILKVQYTIADDHQRLSSILAAGPSAATSSAQIIRDLTTDIKNQALVLASNGGLGIKNPATQNTFKADAESLASIAIDIENALQQAGVLK